MEIALGIGIGVLIAFIVGKRKGHDSSIQPHPPTSPGNETPEQRKQREADELITVILPTINNGQEK